MIIPTTQTGKKEQKCLCFSQSRFLFVFLICFVNACDGSCNKINKQRTKSNAVIPLMNPCVFRSTELSLRVLNFNFAFQIKRTRRVSETPV